MPISNEELVKIPIIWSYDADENCKTIIYPSNQTGKSQLYLIKLDSQSEPIQLTQGKEPVLMAFLDKKGENIIALQDKDGDEIFQLFLLPVTGGELIKITKTPYRTMAVAWHPNGKEVTRSFVSMSGAGLETINIKTKESFLLKENTPPLMDVKYSNDGRWLACTKIKTFTNTEVIIFNREDPSDTIVYNINENSRDGFPSWSPDSKKLAIQSEATGWGQVVIQEFQGDEQNVLELEGEEGVPGVGDYVSWSPKGNAVYYTVNKHSRTTIRKQSVNGGKTEILPFPIGTTAKPKISKDGQTIMALHSSMSSPLGVYRHKMGSNKAIPITPRDFKIDISQLKEPQSVWYESFDKKKIHAWYIPPFDERTPSPAVIYSHGGPWGQVNDCWVDGAFMQPFSQSGFGVLGPNFRGSTGYGSEFQNLDIGDPGGGDLEDVVYGAKWLKDRNEIMGNKIAIMGASYGGYMTLIALTKKPNVFITGVSLVPVVDWLEMYKLSDSYFKMFEKTLLGGPPRGKSKEIYIDRSPITHVSNIKAPVMIMAGKADSRCPWAPIEQFIEKLKEMNHPHEIIIEEKAGHISALLNHEQSVPIFQKMFEYIKKQLL